jgi:hypothetical protein
MRVRLRDGTQLTELKQMLPINQEFKSGDTIGFMLDLRDNARHQTEDDSENLALAPPGRGKLTLRYKGKSFLVASNLSGELWPVFNMDNINEQLSLDFVIDGEDGDGTAVIRRTLEVPTRSTCEARFHRVDGASTVFAYLFVSVVACSVVACIGLSAQTCCLRSQSR